MMLLQSQSKYLLQLLSNRVDNLGKGVELDCNWMEFDDIRFHFQASMKNANVVLLSVSLPVPPPEAVFVGGLPFGAIEAIKTAYGVVAHILDPPRDGFNLTMKLNLSKLPPEEESKQALLVKIASVREVVLGAPLRVILKCLASRSVAPDMDKLVALVHRPNESFFLAPQADKVTVIFPMRFKDSVDTILATSFLQEFMDARRGPGLNNAPYCTWASSPPEELDGIPKEALSANAGFVTFVILPRHVEGNKLDKTVWNLLTFHAYVRYHVKVVFCQAETCITYLSSSSVLHQCPKIICLLENIENCSEGFTHTRMRRRVESFIEALGHTKPEDEDSKKGNAESSFKRLSLNNSRSKR